MNPYDTIAHPGAIDVLGYSRQPGAILAAPGQQGPTTVQGDRWRAEIAADNSNHGILADIQIARHPDDAPPVPLASGEKWIPPRQRRPQHTVISRMWL